MMRINSISLFSILLSLLLLAGCSKLECNKGVSSDKIQAVDQTQLQADITAIDAYLTANKVKDVQTEPNGIRYVILKAASGGTPCLENQITVIYEGKLMSTLNSFDSSQGQGRSFILNQVILGWQIMFPTFPKGTKATLYIPSGYAYGAAANGSIPANSNLIFTIELLGIR
jgi:FKBP-type peptidyl-prolyl cis-trans isomerase FkpA